ncbi:hypothetical protein RRG08_017338 [Elysia crispata]|uniref:Sfi1 spindle body domain-containing protein n=1 Tax=Elysia crispata TaxID=231223 RepID=A0AAE0XQN0_9GAST|nr:hypothetical protein RRG08_017338 [Elysia crispata]
MADWKLMLRVWGAWRSHVRGRRLEFETELHERNIIEAERHRLMAERHFSCSILRRCMLAWQQFVAESVQRKELEAEQARTKNKMAALLSAVAEGKLSSKSETGSEGVDNSTRSKVSSARSTHSAKAHSKTTERSNQQLQKGQAWTASTGQSRPVTADRNSNHSPQPETPETHPTSPSKRKSTGASLPTEPWQVTRRHLNLTKEQIANLGGDLEAEEGEEGESPPHSQVEIRRRFGTQPWMNRQFIPNSFEHRYTAQQVALKEQQAQIREQRRLIEELQYEQRQQMLRQRLLPGSQTSPPTPSASPEFEAPPQGRQIPRDENSTFENGYQVKSITPPRSRLQGQGQGTVGDTNHKDQSVEDHSARCGLQTDRSDLTSATSATNISAATGATQNSKYLKVLKNMEDRAAERARTKAERDERRRQQDEEKAAQILREEEERLQQAEAEKKARIEAFRQKKRLEKQREEEKQREQARQEEMTQLADAHYRRAILKYRGLLPFKKLISLAKRNWLKAVRHHEKCLVRQCLHAWRRFADDEMARKAAVADQMRDFILTKRCFLNWRHYKYHQHFLERRAQKHHAEAVRLKTFLAWVAWTQEEREETRRMEEEASERYTRNLVKKSFVGWRDLPQKMKREEEKQKRKLELRKRVAELIPDFKPTEQITPSVSSVVESEDIS